MRLHRSNRAKSRMYAVGLAVAATACAVGVLALMLILSIRQVAAETPPASAKPDVVKPSTAAPEASSDKPNSPMPPAAGDAAPAPAPAGEHPLDPALVIARGALDRLTNKVTDYTCV